MPYTWVAVPKEDTWVVELRTVISLQHLG